MALPKTYSTGTVSVAGSGTSAAVTGSGTSWLSTIKADDVFCRGGYSVRVLSVTDDTHLTLAENWPGATLSGSAYEIRITFDGPEFLQTARKIWSMLSSLVFYVADATSSAYQDFYEQTTNGTNRVRLKAAASLTGDRTFTLPDVDMAFSSFSATLLDDTSAAAMQATLGLRPVLTGNLTYYVRTDGSNSNTGLANTAGGAFLTIQKAVDVAATLDFNGYTVTIQIGDGTYTAGALVGLNVGQKLPSQLVIRGNSGTPANVLISVTNAIAIEIGNGGQATVQDLKVQATTSGYGLAATRQSAMVFSNIVFGACATAQMYVADMAHVRCAGNYSITAGSIWHIYAQAGCIVLIGSVTVTLTGTPAFSASFVYAEDRAGMKIASVTYSGAATGSRYNAVQNAVINTGGGGASYFPGNSAGTTSTGGIYA